MFFFNTSSLKALIIFTFAYALTATSSVAYQAVKYGSPDPDEDSCGAVVAVQTANAPVYDAPSANGAPLANLATGTLLAYCDDAGGGTWYGVVLLRDGEDCRTGTPVTPRRDYDGPCPMGWIAAKDVVLMAG